MHLYVAAENEEKERENSERRAASRPTRAALRASLSLREMIDFGESYIFYITLSIRSLSMPAVRFRSHTPLSSIQEILDSTPESDAAIRRRKRRERRLLEEERLREESERALSSRYQHRRPYDRSTPGSRYI